jgi:hypothetical protein
MLTNLINKTTDYYLLIFLSLIVSLLLATIANAENEIISNNNNELNDVAAMIDKHRNEISSLEITHGPQHEAIGEHLFSLSKLYQSQGDHIKRLEVLQEALHIHRLNYGLESKEQLQIVEQIISTNLYLEDWMALDQSYEYYYWVNRRVYGTNSLDLLPALNRIMEWKLNVIKKGLFGHPEIIKHQATDLLRKIRKIKEINTEKS